MDYASKSIMEIVEAHLSPTPKYAGSNKVGKASELDKLLESSEKEQPMTRREAIRQALNAKRYS